MRFLGFGLALLLLGGTATARQTRGASARRRTANPSGEFHESTQ